jgi:hypothetical protein
MVRVRFYRFFGSVGSVMHLLMASAEALSILVFEEK